MTAIDRVCEHVEKDTSKVFLSQSIEKMVIHCFTHLCYCPKSGPSQIILEYIIVQDWVTFMSQMIEAEINLS